MVKVISVKFRGNCRSYYFDPGEYDIQTGDGVIVETSRGEEYGDVVEGVKEIEETLVPAALKPVIRVATEEDARIRQEFIAKESDAFMLCQERIADHKLDMKLVDVEYTYNGSKIVFYFTADERVDFRDLVKDLAYALRTRIELRQIGVRDEAKMLGGLGPCGRPVCCKAFLDDFRPVSIKMAKEQNLSLSPTKISGLCGRLMCCLQYEQYAYEEAHKRLPRVGKELETPEGVGIVTECNVLTERVKVRLTEDDGSFEVKEFACTDVGPGSLGRKPEPKQPEAEEPAAAPSEAAAQPAGKPADAAGKKPERSGEQRDRRSRHERPRREKTAETAGEQSKPAAPQKDGEKKNGEERKERRDNRDQGRKNGEERKEHEPARKNGEENRTDKPAEGGEGERRNGRRRGHRGGRGNGEGRPENAEKRENAGNKPAQAEKREKPAAGERSSEKRERIAEKPAADKHEITRLPGETIGMGKQEQPAAASAPASPAHRSNLHRKHSFGPRK